MKTKLLKVVLPLFAFLVATAFALATEKNASESGVLGNEYISKNGQCQSVSRGCNNESDTPCMYSDDSGEYQVYSNRSGTTCSSARFHRP